MIRHLTSAEYTTMPWANGKGSTVEMLREAAPDGTLKWRLSRASVVEDGPFSLFAGIERNLTVISGPGFDLQGEAGLHLQARPLEPLRFAGDVALQAVDVSAPSDDFNVMTARTLPLPEVAVLQGNGQVAAHKNAQLLAVFAVQAGHVNGLPVAGFDLLLHTNPNADLALDGTFVVVWFYDR